MNVPDVAFRDLVAALNQLHRDAGLPSVSNISFWTTHNADRASSVTDGTVRAMLRGAALPRWPKLRAVVRVLAQHSPGTDVEQNLRRFQELWLRAAGAATGDRGAAGPDSPEPPMPPRDWLGKHSAPSQGAAGHGWQVGWQAGWQAGYLAALDP